METKIYQKAQSKSFFKLLGESLKDIKTSFFLAKQLAKRDIKAQYRQSYFGIFWAFITPVATALVWIILNNSGVVKLTDTGMPYPLYAFTGTLIWSIFVASIKSPTQSTNAARSILSKINFPKEALIISGILKLIFNSSIKVLLLFVFIFIYGVGFHWTLLAFPLAIIGAIIIGTTVGLLMTPFGLLYRDIDRVINFVIPLLMYITPVVYITPNEPGLLRTLMDLNPITPLLLTARDLIVGSTPEHLFYFCVVLLLCIPLGLLALVFYRLSIPIIVERLSA